MRTRLLSMWNMVIMSSPLPVSSLRMAVPPLVWRKVTRKGSPWLLFPSQVPLRVCRRSNVLLASDCANAATDASRKVAAARLRNDFMGGFLLVVENLNEQFSILVRSLPSYSTRPDFPFAVRLGRPGFVGGAGPAASSFAYSDSTKAFKLFKLVIQNMRYCSSQESTAFRGAGFSW